MNIPLNPELPPMVSIALAVSESAGISIDDLRGLSRGGKDVKVARATFAVVAVRLGHQARKASEYLRRSDAYAVKAIEDKRFDADRAQTIFE